MSFSHLSLSRMDVFSSTPSLPRNYSNFTLGRGLVRTSAVWSSVQNTIARRHLSAPYHVWSDIESLCASTCHEIHDSLTSAHNSVITVNHSWLWNLPKQSCNKFTKPNCFSGCWTNYRILDLCSTDIYWFLLPNAPGNDCEPKLKHPEVIFLSLENPSQSESVNPCNFKAHSESYRRPYPTLPHNYLSTCFAAIQWIFLGSHIN